MMIGPAPMMSTLSMSVRFGMTSALEVARPDPPHDGMLLGQRDRRRNARAIGVDPGPSRTPAGKHCGVHVERADLLAQQVGPGIERLLQDRPVRLQALDTPVLELGAG